MREAVIVAGTRTAVGKAPRGTLKQFRPDDLAAEVIRDLLAKTPQIEAAQIDDVILGCATTEYEQGGNFARIAALRAGLPVSVAAMTVNRFCSSGSQSIALAAQSVMSGMSDIVLAGGGESMSFLMNKVTFSPNPSLVETMPETYMTMGLTAETLARRYGISREDADCFAARSHERAAAAQSENKFADDGITPLTVETVEIGADGKRTDKTQTFDRDEGIRPETTVEGLAKLKPVFHAKGTGTAGNSSQTSDGAAVVLVMSREKADELGLQPLARFVSYAVGGVAPEIMGMGPIAAVPKALKTAGLNLSDIDLIELNEAFACQALAVMRELGMDESKVNVNGGAVALGHPLGATGAKLTVQLMGEMRRRKSRYGMVTMCVGGGQGAATIFENLQN
jgi:acetyl-CoA acyltransferase